MPCAGGGEGTTDPQPAPGCSTVPSQGCFLGGTSVGSSWRRHPQRPAGFPALPEEFAGRALVWSQGLGSSGRWKRASAGRHTQLEVPRRSCVTLSPPPPRLPARCPRAQGKAPGQGGISRRCCCDAKGRVCSHSCLAQGALITVSLLVSRATPGPGSLCWCLWLFPRAQFCSQDGC